MLQFLERICFLVKPTLWHHFAETRIKNHHHAPTHSTHHPLVIPQQPRRDGLRIGFVIDLEGRVA